VISVARGDGWGRAGTAAFLSLCRWRWRRAASVPARGRDALGGGGVVEAGAILRIPCLG